jgi:hypothetical protein
MSSLTPRAAEIGWGRNESALHHVDQNKKRCHEFHGNDDP